MQEELHLSPKQANTKKTMPKHIVKLQGIKEKRKKENLKKHPEKKDTLQGTRKISDFRIEII